MKKRLLLITMLVALLACVFAISVGAVGSTSNEFAEASDTLEGVSAPSVIGTSERVVLLGSDGLYYTYPAYYILKDQTSFSITQNKALNVALGYDESTSSLKDYVVRIEIPNGITHMGTDLNYKSNLVYVKMSNTVTSVSTKVFQSCTNLETLILSNNLSGIPTDFCHSCSSLTAIEIPASVTTIGGYSFDGCSSLASVVNYAENVTEIQGNAFAGCPITEFNFPNALTKIGASAFVNCRSLASIELPKEVTSIGDAAFQNCSSLTSLVIPEGVSVIGHNVLHGCSNLKELTVPEGCTVYGKYSFNQNGSNMTIIYTGQEGDDGYNSFKTYLTQATYVFKNHCDVYYNEIHNAPQKYIFTSFVKDCYTEGVCSRCGITEKGENFAPMFSFNGYSTNGEEICVGYSINLASLEKYNANKGEAVFNYGFAVSANNNAPINSDGTFASNSINVDLTNEKYASVDFILTGDWSNSKYAEAEISMNLYTMVTEGENTTVSYIYGYSENDKIITQSYETADSVSYNDLNPKTEA